MSALSLALTACAGLRRSDPNAYPAEEPAPPAAAAPTPEERERRLLELETTNQTLHAKIESLEAKLRAAEARTEIRQKSDAAARGAPLTTAIVSGEGLAESTVTDSVTPAYQQAKALFDAKKYPESILGFSSFVEKYPAHVLAGLAQYYLADAYFEQGEFALSEQEYYQVIGKHPRSPLISFAYQRLGLALRKQGKTREAEAAESQVEALFPGSPAAAAVSQQKNLAPEKPLNSPADGVPPTADPIPSEKS